MDRCKETGAWGLYHAAWVWECADGTARRFFSHCSFCQKNLITQFELHHHLLWDANFWFVLVCDFFCGLIFKTISELNDRLSWLCGYESVAEHGAGIVRHFVMLVCFSFFHDNSLPSPFTVEMQVIFLWWTVNFFGEQFSKPLPDSIISHRHCTLLWVRFF